MQSKLGKIFLYGHRGARKYAPENTLPSFQKAVEQGADGFELDTMLTADGVPVVIHDRALGRTTDGTGFVDQMKYKDLKRLDAGSWFSESFRNTKIPLLETVLDEFGGQTEINIELKNLHDPFDDLPVIVCDMVEKAAIVSKVIFSSFVPFNLLRIRKMIPDARIALLVAPDWLGKALASRILSFISPDLIHPHSLLCTNRFVSNQHTFDRKINAWTVNKTETCIELIERGVDGIITDDPARINNAITMFEIKRSNMYYD